MKRMVKISLLLVLLLGGLANIGGTAEMKTVMFLRIPHAKMFVSEGLKGLEQAGFMEQQNLRSVVLDVTEVTEPAQIVADVQKVAPDVVISIGISPIVNALLETGIPLIVIGGIEAYVDVDGISGRNITGIYFMLQDQLYNSYKFLQKVAPLNAGQQAVLLDNPEASMSMSKEDVTEALQRLGISLKTVINASVFEDCQAALLKYSNDPEVGWILLVNPPTRKRDGGQVDRENDFFPLVQEFLKKPSVTHVEINVQGGMLCGFGIDLNDLGMQSGRMAARVLQGEDIRSIKAEYPQKISIALNRKTATTLGIIFSLDILKLANVIYDDYEGQQVIRK